MSEFNSFERAFAGDTAGCRRTCHCGIEYYNPDECWTWEDGELEQLNASENSRSSEFSIGSIEFEGREYVDVCDCWHDLANQLIKFLSYNDREIAKFLNLERERKINQANLVEKLEE